MFILGRSLVLSPRPKLTVSNQDFHTVAEYTTYAQTVLSSVRDRNKVTFDENGFVSKLEDHFPEISQVRVELPVFSEQPIITLNISEPSFLLSSDGLNYIVSQKGRVVARASELPKLNHFVVVTDQTGFSTKLGAQVLSASDVSFINTLVAQAKHAKVPISSLSLPPKPQELDLRTSDQPYFVKFYLSGDSLDEIGQFLVARTHFLKTKQPPSKYLDVRVPGKIYYK
ncbi:MAG TPA: hypothetical protein VFW90_01750 [Candidatus Saccharimonadales bacterium]|nr:hypothetical protein [Candidatus Saccharimonadales bacterium]